MMTLAVMRLAALTIAGGIAVAATLFARPAVGAPSATSNAAKVPGHTETRHTANVVCQPLFVCDIVLDPGESILAMATGDSVRWILNTVMSGPQADIPHVLVKPTDYGLRTNLVIATDRRVCYIILVSVKHDYQYRARFYYPVADVAHIATASDDADGTLLRADKLDVAYRIAGDRRLAPVRVMNDGSHTYLQMSAALAYLPVVYGVADDGSDAVINYRFRHSMFVVDGVPNKLVLVSGSGRAQRRCTVERETQP